MGVPPDEIRVVRMVTWILQQQVDAAFAIRK